MTPGAATGDWAALREAGDVVAAMAGVEPVESPDLAALMRSAPEWRRELAERTIETIAAAMGPGIEGLWAIAARGAEPRPAALALWHEFARARDDLFMYMALNDEPEQRSA